MATAAVRQALLSAEEFADRQDNGMRSDLLAGEVLSVSPAGFQDGRVVARLSFRLSAWAEAHRGKVTVVGAETGFLLARNPDTVLAPDAAVVLNERLPEPAERRGFLPLAPDLAVEVVSPSDRFVHVNAKVQTYLAAGTRLVWLVDPDRRTMQVFAPDGSSYTRSAAQHHTLDAADLLPDFALPLSDLFEE